MVAVIAASAVATSWVTDSSRRGQRRRRGIGAVGWSGRARVFGSEEVMTLRV